jgi:hypothetical protein
MVVTGAETERDTETGGQTAETVRDTGETGAGVEKGTGEINTRARKRGVEVWYLLLPHQVLSLAFPLLHSELHLHPWA